MGYNWPTIIMGTNTTKAQIDSEIRHWEQEIEYFRKRQKEPNHPDIDYKNYKTHIAQAKSNIARLKEQRKQCKS